MLYPLADVEVEVGGRRIQVEAAVSDTLPMSVLLGTDVEELGELLGEGILKKAQEQKDEAVVVTTRAQARRQEREEAIQHQKELESGARANPVTEEETNGEEDRPELRPEEVSIPSQEQGESTMIGGEFEDDIFVTSREKIRLTRSEKRIARRQFAQGLGAEEETGPIQHALDVTSGELAEMQGADETLVAVRKAAEGTPSTAGSGFFKRDGLFYRQWTPPGQDAEEMAVEQLVLPQQCRGTVLHLAHTIPLAGHMGRDKTT